MPLRLYSRVVLKRSLCDDDGTMVPAGTVVVVTEELGADRYRAEITYKDALGPRTVSIAVMESEVEPAQ
jgi:hypothetical protein